MEEGSPISGIMLILLLVLINAIVIIMRTALENISENSIKKKAEAGERYAVHILHLLEHQGKYSNVLELIQGLCGISVGIVYARNLIPAISKGIQNSNLRSEISYIGPVCYALSILLLVFISTLLGGIIPKKFAIKYEETILYYTRGIIGLLGFILSPFAWLLEKIMNIILRIFGVKPSSLEDNVTEDEIISMVNEGHEQGVFDAGEAEMISNIIELDEKEAEDIMTHKKRILAVNADMSVEEALHYMLSENYSRYPLYEDNRDNITGILHLKDVTSAYISEELRKKPLKEFAREPYFVPDTQNINILFHDMQAKNVHMAIVIDEYGQTAGLVAMEDFIEEIVGNIQDEYDKEESMVISREEEAYVVKGSISLEELVEDLNIVIDHEDYDTLNGLLISILGRIPADGEKETLEYEGYQFEILETRNKMIEQVRISKITEAVPEPIEMKELV